MGTKNKIIGIYCIENIDTNKKYIGQSKDIEGRWYKHKNELRHNSHDNDYLQKAWNKYGENRFEFSILEECDESELNEKEVYYIDHFNTLDYRFGYNLKEGGQSGSMTEYGKIKQRNSLKETYKNTDLKERRRQDAINQWADPTIKLKICGSNNGMYGKHHSEETKEKLRKMATGRISGKRDKRKIFCIELNKFFECSADAAKELHTSTANILSVCRGIRKTAGGYHWKFVTENNI